MKAAVFQGTRSILIEEVPKPMLTAPRDAIVRVTHCTICGSDLHMYSGALNKAVKKGDIMGHEAIGIVEEVGPDVEKIVPGDRVIILPIIACGDCFYCKRKEYSLCDATNPSKEMEELYGHRLSGIFGYSHLTGGYPGNQAEWCRVPNADLTCVKAPHDVDPKKLLGLADVTPTAWHGCELAQVGEGDVVGVWGCGAVGLSIQRLAKLRGAKTVYAMDHDIRRLQLAKVAGMVPVNVADKNDVAGHILSVEALGLDRGIEASGFRSAQSLAHKGMRALKVETDSCETVSDCIKATRKGGNVALIGDFFFYTNRFPIGMLMEKTITLRGGQLMAQKYHPFLLDMVLEGKYDPSWMFTHEANLEDIDKWYGYFDRHSVPGGLKVLLTTEFGRTQALKA
ncbi:alcohol dehydrogenase GroES-like domain-containing protein [Colletotrichum sojae]|uniref:Alcohol dehydrogenase GroES-like domain-containing protein n=1 Tax=Colletotrichum sojae TaxID=2175907 RepID=A0A8H6J5N7_9PEZI|nr:alcohol dehydrogenase GroES-like domain-containing protein [Colletotrichum sojae]